MKHIIEKLYNNENSDEPIETWTMEEKKKLIELYLLISKKESKIFKFMYQFKGCDCFGSNYLQYLEDKAEGVEEAFAFFMKNNEKTLNLEGCKMNPSSIKN